MRYLKGFFCSVVCFMIFLWGAIAGAEEIVIGYSGPLSGPAAEYGQDCVNGVDMAVNELNQNGGIAVGGKKYKFKLERLDDRSDPTVALNNARRFKANGAIAVFNSLLTTVSAIAKINEDKGQEFILMAFTSTPKILELKNKLVIFPNPSDVYRTAFVEWALSQGYKKCAMMVTMGSYGDDWRKTFKAIYEKKGGTITADKPVNYYTETDFSAPLTAALKTNPDCMLIGGPSATTALVIEQARALGFKGGFMLIEQAKADVIVKLLKDSKLMGNSIANTTVMSIPRPPNLKNFIPNYEHNYKRMYTWEAEINYMFMRALARAMVAAGTATDIYKIRAAFPKAYPMTRDKFPGEHLGITPEGGIYAWGATQTITDGKFNPTVMYASWPKTQKEWDAVLKMSKKDKSIVKKWNRPEK